MTIDEVQVIPEDLTGKAIQLRALPWSTMAAQPTLVAPDALATSGVAVTNLAVNAEAMWEYQEFGRLEGLRLAQTLDNVSAAYADIDDIAGEDIGNTMLGPGSPSVPDGTRFPKGVDLPTPPHPPSMPIPKGQLVSEQMLFPPDAQRALEAGDQGTSLRAAAGLWRSNAESLATFAQQFETNSLLWEGEAADAAYAKFNAYRRWLISLAGSWKQLATEADRMSAAHSTAKRDNRPVAENFEKLQREIAQNPASADNLRKTLQMAALQNQSEEIRHQYARAGQPNQIQPDDPPSPLVSGIPVTVDDHRRARMPPSGDRRNQEAGLGQGTGLGQQAGEGAAGLAGPPAGGDPQAEQPAIPPASAAEPPPQGAPQSGGSPGAGQSGGGPQGGSQGGLQPGTGSPISPNGAPKLPGDPGMKPAASGRGGSVGGKFGGGGGLPGSPLQPAVGAETVAPVPMVAPIAAPGAGAAAGGMAGGGMGGMAPMMHGGKGDGSGERKRNPQLSQDEQLYTEDRPWTEAIIGNRVRRRSTSDDMKKSQ